MAKMPDGRAAFTELVERLAKAEGRTPTEVAAELWPLFRDAVTQAMAESHAEVFGLDEGPHGPR